jgi:hypothetical protein
MLFLFSRCDEFRRLLLYRSHTSEIVGTSLRIFACQREWARKELHRRVAFGKIWRGRGGAIPEFCHLSAALVRLGERAREGVRLLSLRELAAPGELLAVRRRSAVVGRCRLAFGQARSCCVQRWSQRYDDATDFLHTGQRVFGMATRSGFPLHECLTCRESALFA